MKVNLIGLRTVDFEGKSGQPVQGVKLFMSYPEENVYGRITDERFISAPVFANFDIKIDELIELIGTDIDIEISPRGKVVGIHV